MPTFKQLSLCLLSTSMLCALPVEEAIPIENEGTNDPLEVSSVGESTIEQSLAPFHIVRDLLQPLGMPVVTGYHKMRENVFLNTREKHAHGLEAIGNFFLAPSRYLFAGKTVEIQSETDDSCRITPSFHYKKLHWLKTTLTLAFLPITEPLGIFFKGLSYLSPRVRERNQEIKRRLERGMIHSQLEQYRTLGLSLFYSEDFIPCLHHKTPASLTGKQKTEIAAFQEITTLLDQHGILYWIDCGTALGAYRYGGIIPWDWDIDIAILLPDHANVKKILSQLDPNLYQIQDWSSYTQPETFLKLYVKKTHNFIDIYHYQLYPKTREIAYLYTYLDSPFPESWKKDELKSITPLKYEEIFPLKRAHFNGLTVWAPNNIVSYLRTKYGDNLEPSNVWDEEAHIYRKVANHPYWQ